VLADPHKHKQASASALAGAAALLLWVGAVLMLAACGSSTAGSTAPAAARRVPVDAGGGQSRAGGCAPAHAPAPRGAQRVSKPKRTLDPHKRYLVQMSTNCGTIEIALAVRSAPRTTASFAYLVARGFYDGLTFHRVAAGFVIQGGDPNGDGTGGPGYSVVEPPPSDTQYTRGTVAMAKTSTDPSGASGSQFFIVTAARAPLPPQYALVGQVVGGMAGVEAIGRLPTDPPRDGAPKQPVVIGRASLRSS
jgi:cyclophilin family peptidyl-prolyl cis-trans isomerase